MVNDKENAADVQAISLFEELNMPREYFTVSKSKQYISKVIYDATELNKEEHTLRNMAKKLHELYGNDVKTPHFNTILKITSGENYTVDNLLMLLDLLGKKILIVDRTEKENDFIEKRGRNSNHE